MNKQLIQIIILLFFIVPLNVYSQNSIKSIGFFFDVNQNEINGYLDKDYEGTSYLKKNYSFTSGFGKGNYYDLQGNVNEGEIKEHPTKESIFYFRSDKSTKIEKINIKNCSGYTVGLDSFIVRDNISVSSNFGIPTLHYLGFVLENSEMKVFKHDISNSYFIDSKVHDSWAIIPKKGDKFIKVITPYIKFYQNLHQRVVDKKLTHDDVFNILATYDAYVKFKNNVKTYYTEFWNETKSESDAKFYSKINIVEDSVFHISYFDVNENKILDGHYSSFFPNRKNGEFTWYLPSGKVKKSGKFKNDDTDSLFTEYYSSGSKYRLYKINNNQKNYTQVYSLEGNELLAEGSGNEVFYDSVMNRDLYRTYKNHQINECYFFSEQEEKIYQKADINAKMKKSKVSFINEELKYSRNALNNNLQSTVLLRVIISAEGKTDSFSLIKGLEQKIDDKILATFAKYSKYKIWTPSMMNGKKVKQELIVPILFTIGTKYIRQNFYYHDFHHLHHMHMINQPLNITPPPMPRGF